MTREEFAQWCLDNILPSVLSDPGTREDLEAFYNLVGQVEEEIVGPNRDGLAAVVSPDDCPLSPVMEKVGDSEIATGMTALDGLLGLAGFGRALAWVRDLDQTTKRRLIRLGARLWRTKGTTDGTRALLMALTGRDPLILDWPFWRYTVEDAFPLLAWTSPESGGDLEQTIFLADPDASLDRERIRAALESVRPSGDTWTILWALLADTFGNGLYLWNPAGGPSVASGAAVLPDGASLEAATGGAWDVGRILADFSLDAGAVAEFRVGNSGGEFLLTVGESTVTVQAVVGGVPSLVVSASVTLAAGTRIILDWGIFNTVAGTEFRVTLDGNLVAIGTL